MTLWTVARQAPLSMGFSRQEYWSGLPRSPPGNLPDPGIEPVSPESLALQADSLLSEPPGTSGRNPPANAGNVRAVGLIPGSGRSPGGERGNPLQYSCLENPMDGGA